jgi:hypothetical protein
LRFTGIPSFAPELLQTCRAGDPMKAKHLDKALMQFAEEGAAKVFKPTIGSGFVVGVVGALQFEVLASRIELEYGLPVRFEPSQFTSARWVSGPKDKVEAFAAANKQHMAADNDGDPVYLTRMQWDIDRVERDRGNGASGAGRCDPALHPAGYGPPAAPPAGTHHDPDAAPPASRPAPRVPPGPASFRHTRRLTPR